MSKAQIEKQYNLKIEKQDNVYFVYNSKNNILLFLAPDLDTITKSMEFLGKEV